LTDALFIVTSLVSGVGIFCLGAGVSVWHGATSAVFPHELIGSELQMAYLVLAGSALIDSIVLMKVGTQIITSKCNFYAYYLGLG